MQDIAIYLKIKYGDCAIITQKIKLPQRGKLHDFLK